MSNSDALQAYRAQLHDLDAPPKQLQDSAPSMDAAVQIGRARGMIRGAEQRLTAALLRSVDGVAA